MKLSQVIQSIFLGLVLMGLFATMAQNGYGFTLMGTSCFGLAILYFAQASWKVLEDYSALGKKDLPGISELIILSFLLILFGLRAFYINVPNGNIIFISLSIFLMGVYVLIAAEFYRAYKNSV